MIKKNWILLSAGIVILLTIGIIFYINRYYYENAHALNRYLEADLFNRIGDILYRTNHSTFRLPE